MTGMTLPPAVQQQVDAANAALASQTTDTPAVAPEEVEVVQVIEDVVADPSAVVEAVDPKPDAPDLTEMAEKLRRMEAKYKTLEGKYNNEVPRLRQDLEARDAVIGDLTERLSQAPAKQTPEAPMLDLSELKGEFGAELVGMVEVVAGDIATRMFTKLAAELRAEAEEFFTKVDRVEQRSTQTDEQLFLRDVSAEISDFDAKNTDPDFIAWLDSVDRASGLSYRQMLGNAQAARSVTRVKHIFDLYWGAQQPQQIEQPQTPAPTVSDEVVVAPRRGGSTTPIKPEVEVWTDAKIAKFYADIQRGVYRGKDAERDAIEADIFAARREGRYTPK